MSRSCCRWCACGCRSETGDVGEGFRDRAAAPAKRDLSEVSLRFPWLRRRLDEAAPAKRNAALRLSDAVAAAGPDRARPDDVRGAARVSHRAGERDVPRSLVL